MLANLHFRLTKIEARRPAMGPVKMANANDPDPAGLVLWLGVDIEKMTLAQLDLLEENLRRFTV